MERPGIKRIAIGDFRAFPKSQPAILDVDGCNLLVFGGNGAGKSSIYRALRGLFSTKARDIAEMRNVFTPEDTATPFVEVIPTGNDAPTLRWDATGHPTGAVTDFARRAAFLSYSRLVETVRSDSADTPANLFPMAVDFILADFEATTESGGKRSIGELWATVLAAHERRVTRSGKQERATTFRREVDALLAAFNDGMNQAIDALETRARVLLRRMLDVLSPDALELVAFTFFPVRLNEDFSLSEQVLTVRVRYGSYAPNAPQSFLNEGRQSALALAIHLAARLICVPPGEEVMKLLVLDDLLISLDYSHRRPVLDVLAELFATWQIVLLTHDRFWFELAREQLLLGPWKAIEIYEEVDGDGLLTPIVRTVLQDPVDETLKQARRFLDQHYPAAAANYARAACELTLRRYCRKHRLAVPYHDEPQKISFEDLRGIGSKKAKDVPACRAAFDGLQIHQRFILNPLSHNPAEPVEEADVRAAIDAVALLSRETSAHKP